MFFLCFLRANVGSSYDFFLMLPSSGYGRGLTRASDVPWRWIMVSQWCNPKLCWWFLWIYTTWFDGNNYILLCQGSLSVWSLSLLYIIIMMLVITTIFTIVIFILIAIITNVSMGTTYQLINRRKDNGQQWVLCTSTLECDNIPPMNGLATIGQHYSDSENGRVSSSM